MSWLRLLFLVAEQQWALDVEHIPLYVVGQYAQDDMSTYTGGLRVGGGAWAGRADRVT